MVMDADFSLTQAAEIFLSLVRAGTVKAVSLSTRRDDTRKVRTLIGRVIPRDANGNED